MYFPNISVSKLAAVAGHNHDLLFGEACPAKCIREGAGLVSASLVVPRFSSRSVPLEENRKKGTFAVAPL